MRSKVGIVRYEAYRDVKRTIERVLESIDCLSFLKEKTLLE